jgi:hypothetical protein
MRNADDLRVQKDLEMMRNGWTRQMRPFGYFADAHSPAPSRERGDNSLPRFVAYCGEEFSARGELFY